MSNMNEEILLLNIHKLMSEKGTTQAELARILGMSQPNISKALNKKDKKSFTLKQIFDIATYYNVSIDELVGRSTVAPKSKREIAHYIATLLQQNDASLTKITKHEIIYDWQPDNYPYDMAFEREADNEYTALYFPNYWSLPDAADLTEDEKDDLVTDLHCNGNANGNFGINEFLNNISKIIGIYLKKQIPEDAFQSILKSYLDKIDITDSKYR